MRARELRVEAHIKSRVEIDRGTAPGQQAVELGAAKGGTVGGWLECSVRQVVRSEVERLEREHGSRECTMDGISGLQPSGVTSANLRSLSRGLNLADCKGTRQQANANLCPPLARERAAREPLDVRAALRRI